MRDYLYLGSAPCDENCVQVDPKVDYLPALRAECLRYQELLEKIFTSIPDGCSFFVKSQGHDFGEYCEVCVRFDDDDEDQCEFAYFVEANIPNKWDDDAVMDHRAPREKILKY